MILSTYDISGQACNLLSELMENKDYFHLIKIAKVNAYRSDADRVEFLSGTVKATTLHLEYL